MKKVISVLIAVIMMIGMTCPITSMADDGINIIINGQVQQYDQMPVIVNGRTLVPLRGIFEALGAVVSWDDSTKTIIGVKATKSIVLQIDNTFASINNEATTLDVAPSIMNSRTMVPVRFVSEALGADVQWDGNTRTVTITSPDGDVLENDYRPAAPGTEILNAGTVIVSNDDFLKSKHNNGKISTIEFKDGVLEMVMTGTPENDNKVNLSFPVNFNGIMNEGDICLLSFSAKLNDGGENGFGKVKPYIQAGSDLGYLKSLFATTSFGKEWTNCYLPFVAKAGMANGGIRLASLQQSISIKDVKLVNYGNTVTFASLPNTIDK